MVSLLRDGVLVLLLLAFSGVNSWAADAEWIVSTWELDNEAQILTTKFG